MKGTFFLGAAADPRFEVRDMQFDAPGAGEVLVQVKACGVCGTDVHIYHGEAGSADVTPPVVLGHEFAGVVTQVGEGVTELKVGDHVAIDPNAYCGKCRPCRMGKKQNCEHLYALGVSTNGGFAEYALCPAAQCFKVGADIPFDVAAMAEPLACVIHGIDNAAITIGQNVLVIGGGNIGRGFIGATLSQSGYAVTFIDVAEPVVKALSENHRYPVRYVSTDGYEDVVIENVTAVNGNDAEAASEAIANCDIMATAVGARILKFIVGNIVAGLRKRWTRTDAPLNIIICENLMDANLALEKMLKEQLTEEECKIFDERVGLVEASIGRMVPVQTEEMKDGDPMRVCVERYGFLPTDKAAFKGEIPEIKNMVPFAPFDFYIKRKLYIHNMGHATCAYLGNLMGLDYIYQAIDVPEIRILVQNAMLESAMALSKKYGVELEGVLLHITDLLGRFTNAALGDTTARVGGDPGRKLNPDDRLIGSSLLALEQGITPAYIAVGAAAGLHRYIQEAEMPQNLESANAVLTDVSKLDADCKLRAMILDMYGLILDGKSVKDLLTAADMAKAASLGSIV